MKLRYLVLYCVVFLLPSYSTAHEDPPCERVLELEPTGGPWCKGTEITGSSGVVQGSGEFFNVIEFEDCDFNETQLFTVSPQCLDQTPVTEVEVCAIMPDGSDGPCDTISIPVVDYVRGGSAALVNTGDKECLAILVKNIPGYAVDNCSQAPLNCCLFALHPESSGDSGAQTQSFITGYKYVREPSDKCKAHTYANWTANINVELSVHYDFHGDFDVLFAQAYAEAGASCNIDGETRDIGIGIYNDDDLFTIPVSINVGIASVGISPQYHWLGANADEESDIQQITVDDSWLCISASAPESKRQAAAGTRVKGSMSRGGWCSPMSYGGYATITVEESTGDIYTFGPCESCR